MVITGQKVLNFVLITSLLANLIYIVKILLSGNHEDMTLQIFLTISLICSLTAVNYGNKN